MTPLLQVEHLSGGYGRNLVVRDVGLTVAGGEFCALLGLNGCGKTTLIKSICGLLPTREGRCLVDGEDCTKLNERQRALRMSYIPQRGSLITGKTVLEVVLMGCNPRLGLLDSPGERHRKQGLEALARLGLEGCGDREYAALSEGQKQLVILARTLVQDAPVMLMDEPDSALDFVNRNLVLEKVRQVLRAQNRAGLISLHDPNFALSYCDRLLLMKQGAIVEDLPLEQASREDVEAALAGIYGRISVLEHRGGFVMVRA